MGENTNRIVSGGPKTDAGRPGRWSKDDLKTLAGSCMRTAQDRQKWST